MDRSNEQGFEIISLWKFYKVHIYATIIGQYTIVRYILSTVGLYIRSAIYSADDLFLYQFF